MYDNYRMYRDFKGLTDYKVAKETGISRSTFSDWKSGRSVPKLEKLRKIAELLEVPVEYITGKAPVNAQKATLTSDETELLRLFRALPEDKKSALIDYARYQVTKEKTDVSKVG